MPLASYMHRLQARTSGEKLPKTEVPRSPTPSRPLSSGLTTCRSISNSFGFNFCLSLSPALTQSRHQQNPSPLRHTPDASTNSPHLAAISSSSASTLPIKPDLIRHMISLHTKLQQASGPNAFSLRLPVPSGLNIPEWRTRLHGYHDTKLCDFLEFGWPVGYGAASLPTSTYRNYGSALAQPDVINPISTKSVR